MNRNLHRLAVGTAAILATGISLTTATGASAASPAPAGKTVDANHRHNHVTTITATAPALLPESAVYDQRSNEFFVSSERYGTVSAVGLDGSIRTLVDDPTLVSTLGLRVDGERHRVLVANADFGDGVKTAQATHLRLSGVGSYDLRTGARQWYVDLAALAGDGGQHLVNDLYLAPDGTAYVNDGADDIVYRIDPHGHASVLLRDHKLDPTGSIPGLVEHFGQSAIAWVPGNILLVTKADGTVWRIPVAHPNQISQVALTGTLRPIADGIRVFPNGSLAVINNGLGATPGSVQYIRPSNDWRAAKIVRTQELTDLLPTGITAGPRGTTWVLEGNVLDFLQGTPSATFTIHQV